MNESFENGSKILTDIRLKAESLLPYKVGMYIYTYYFPVITTIGLVSNIIALCILFKPKNRKYPCYRTLTALSLSDIVIILSGYYKWVLTLTDTVSETQCRIVTYVFQTAALSSALMVVFVTIHKYLAFVSPFRSHNLRSPSRTLKIIIGIIMFSVAYNTVHIFGDTTIDSKLCVGITSFDTYNKTITWMALAMQAVLPVVFVTILNSLILKAVSVSRKFYQSSVRSNRSQGVIRNRSKKNQTTAVSVGDGKNNNTDATKSEEPQNPLRHYDRPTATYHRQSSILLTTVTCVFAALSPPLYLCFIVYSFVDYTSDAQAYSTYVLVHNICLCLYITNSCINFFLYLGAGTRFRDDVKNLFKPKKSISTNTSSVRSILPSVKFASTIVSTSNSDIVDAGSIKVFTVGGKLPPGSPV